MEHNDKRQHIIWWIALVGTCTAVFFPYIIGQKFFLFCDVGSDTVRQYFPIYINVISKLREGTLDIWNWDNGLGTSILNNLGMYSNPFELCVIAGGVLFGTGVVKYLLVFSQIGKIIVCAVICKSYLRLFNVSNISVLVGSYLYAFSGFLMLWGQHYFMGMGSVYVILLLFCIEKLMRENKWKWARLSSLVIAAIILSNYYHAYIILMMIVPYAIVRIFMTDICNDGKKRFSILIKGVCVVIEGVALTAVVLYPMYLFVTKSSNRLEQQGSALERFLQQTFADISPLFVVESSARMISNNLLYINVSEIDDGSNYYELPQLCISIFIFLVLFQFFKMLFDAYKNRRTRDAVCITVGIVLVVLSVCNHGFRTAFNGFAYPCSRHTMVFIPLMVLMFAVVWDYWITKKGVDYIAIALGVFVSGCILLKTYSMAIGKLKLLSVAYGGIILVFTIALLLYHIREKRIWLYCMFVLVVFTTISEAWITNNKRACMGKENMGWIGFETTCGNVDTDTTKALKYIASKDKSFYRIEKNYEQTCIWSDSFYEQYSGLTTYNSIINRNVQDFYDNLYAKSSCMPANWLFDYEHTLFTGADNRVLDVCNIKYILSRKQLQAEWLELDKVVNGIYIYHNTGTQSIAKWYTKTVHKSDVSAISETERKLLLNNTLIVDNDFLGTYENKDNKAEIGEFSLIKDSHLTGSVKCQKKGLLFLAVPDQPGWTVFVDGEKQKKINADYGFIGVELAEGEHTVDVKYSIPGLSIGGIISIIGLVIYILGIYITRRKR